MVRVIRSFSATYNPNRDSCLDTFNMNLFILFSPIVMLKLLLSMGRRKSPFIRSNPSLMVKKLPMTINSQSKTKKFCASVGPKPVGNISINSESCSLCACFITKKLDGAVVVSTFLFITNNQNRLLPSLAHYCSCFMMSFQDFLLLHLH